MHTLGNTMTGGPANNKHTPIPTTPIGRPGRDALTLHNQRPDPVIEPIPNPTTAHIRAWAITNGHKVNHRGALPQSAKDAYTAAAKLAAR